MSRQVIYLNNGQLARLNKVFASIRPGYTQRVELIYLKGKADPLWTGVSSFARGAARDITVRHKPRFLNALILIDLPRNVPAARMSFGMGGKKLVAHQPTAKEIREELFTTIMHELQHVLQGWVWGENWGAMANQASSDGYHNNRYERASERFSLDWVNQHRSELGAGLFDDIIPAGALDAL